MARVRMRRGTYFAGVDRSETIEWPMSCILLWHAPGDVPFDTGRHPSIARNPEPCLRGMSKLMISMMPPDDPVITRLNCVGLEPHDVDVVKPPSRLPFSQSALLLAVSSVRLWMASNTPQPSRTISNR